jgi:hypothetical protein
MLRQPSDIDAGIPLVVEPIVIQVPAIAVPVQVEAEEIAVGIRFVR